MAGTSRGFRVRDDLGRLAMGRWISRRFFQSWRNMIFRAGPLSSGSVVLRAANREREKVRRSLLATLFKLQNALLMTLQSLARMMKRIAECWVSQNKSGTIDAY